ncbi:MAG TPA: hypothetical protein VIL48_08320 [Acidimicrobiales bacterium]
MLVTVTSPGSPFSSNTAASVALAQAVGHAGSALPLHRNRASPNIRSRVFGIERIVSITLALVTSPSSPSRASRAAARAR